MTLPHTDNDGLNFKSTSPLRHIGEVFLIVVTGTIFGVLFGSIIAFSGVLILGIVLKLFNDNK